MYREPIVMRQKLGLKSTVWTRRKKEASNQKRMKKQEFRKRIEDGGNIGGSGVHLPSTPGKYLADLRSRANSQQYSSIYEDQRPKDRGH